MGTKHTEYRSIIYKYGSASLEGWSYVQPDSFHDKNPICRKMRLIPFHSLLVGDSIVMDSKYNDAYSFVRVKAAAERHNAKHDDMFKLIETTEYDINYLEIVRVK